MKNPIFLLPLLFSMTMCQPKASENTEAVANDSLQIDSLNNPQVTQNLFNGTFEYDGGAWENGYLFYRMELKQTGAIMTGTLFMGNYLNKSEAGGYTMPDATFEIDLHGEAYGEKDAILYLDKIRDSLATDASSHYPNLFSVFTSDAEDNTVQSITLIDQKLQIICNKDTLWWERQK